MVSTVYGQTIRNGSATAATEALGKSIWTQGDAARQARIDARKEKALIRLWDGDWQYIGTVNDPIQASFQWKLNDTGAGHVSIPVDSWLGEKMVNQRSRSRDKNVHVTMDKDGARWSGRLRAMTISKSQAGQEISLEFLHDYEEVKHILVWPNPYLPAAVQFPRSFTMVGPAIWALKMTLYLNVWRLAGSAWALPDDPLDLWQWTDTVNSSIRPIHVTPNTPFLNDSSPWAVVSARMKTWHDVAAPILADSQLSVVCRRYLTGDPEPWEGANLRHGALYIDIEDKSGYWGDDGTATFGDVWKGMVRTVQKVTNDVDVNKTEIALPASVPEYSWTDFLSTVPSAPYVIYHEGPLTGIDSSDLTWEPATDVQVVTGGHSAPGVNELFSMAISLAGSMIGNVLSVIWDVGTILDTFLKPLYEDTVLAWVSIKSIDRPLEAGWSHYYEHFADGADRAYTLSSVVALRQGFWETREKVSHTLNIRDGAPWFVGENGKGHFFVGDRIGAAIVGVGDGNVVVEQVTEATYSVSRSSIGWTIVCGDTSSQKSPLETILARTNRALEAVHDLGVI